MNKAIRIIYDEHRSISAVLSGLKSLAQMARESAVRPDFTVFRAMVYYIDAFPERVHHPRESEYLFRFLRARCQEAAPILDVLEEEHRAGAEHVRRLGQALARYQGGGAAEFPAFASAVESFAAFELEHMRREERDIMPLARAHLHSEDWEVIDAAFAGGAVPIFNPRTTEEYAKLFDRIVMLAPPPIGVGPP